MKSGRASLSARAVALLLAAPTLALAQGRVDSARAPRTAPGAGAQEPRAYVRDAGPGVPGRLLRDALARPHVVVVAPDTGIVFARATDVPTTLLVIGGPARLEGRVRGDFIVLGDLYLRPGAVVEGRAIAFGGDVMNSTLAVVRGGRVAFRDVGFRATRTAPDVYALDYQLLERREVRIVSLPGVVGLRIPTYDRVDGLSLAFGPEIALDTGRVRIEPTVTYRSQLGAFDPGLTATWEPGRRTSLELSAARGTFTNDAWIRSDLVNSATTLYSGSDARNYFRADRAELTVERRYETDGAVVTPIVGALLERSWSAARDSAAPSAPWSLFGRHDAGEGMRRPNPDVAGGTIASALLGVRARRLTGPVTAAGALRAEAPLATTGDVRFVQLTADGQIDFPTFRDQRFQAFTHFVLTGGDSTPSQRYAYVGGSSTIPTLRLLEQGGDRLLWLESRYVVPISAVRLPFFGSPAVTLRHVVGGAGVGRLPTLTQNVGLRLSVGPLRVDFVVDPADPHRHDFGVSVGMR